MKLHFNELIDDELSKYICGKYLYASSILNINNNNPHTWELNLPVTDKKYLILHAQDFVRSEDLVKIEQHQNAYNIEHVVLIHWNHDLKKYYHGNIKLVEFPTHSYELINQLIERQSEWDFNYDKTINFMCLNGIPKQHRKLTVEYLKSNHINGIVTLMDRSDTYVSPYSNYDWDNIGNFIKLKTTYKKSAINIITESLYNEVTGILTEKTLFAFASLQFPILIAHKGAVANARRYGFDMFDDIIDHSYDTLPNNIRWEKALQLNKDLINNPPNNLQHRLLNNKTYLLEKYNDFLVKQLRNSLLARI